MAKKNMRLFIKFFKDIKLSAVLLFLVLLISQFSMVYLYGAYVTCTYYDRCYHQIPGVQRSIYYGYAVNMMDEAPDIAEYQRVIDEIRQKECVECILYMSYLGTVKIQGSAVNIIAMDMDLLKYSVGLKMNAGKLTESGLDPNGNLQIILTPEVFPDYSVDDGIDLQVESNGTVLNIPATILGKYKTAACLPNFNKYSNQMDIYNLLSEYSKTIFVMKTPETEKLLLKNNAYDSRAGFVVFSNSSTEEERTIVLNGLRQQSFSYNTYEDIIKFSKEITEEKMQSALPLPILAFSIAFLFSISMILMILDKKMQTYSIYYLCGLSKVKSYFLILESLGLPELAAMICNAFLTIFYIYDPKGRPELLQEIQFSWNNLYLLLGQAVVIMGIILLEIYLLYRKKSFVEIKNLETK